MQLPSHRPGGVQSLGRADTRSGQRLARTVERALKPASDYALALNDARKENELLGNVAKARTAANNLANEMETLSTKRLGPDELSEAERVEHSDILAEKGYVPGNRIAARRYEKGRQSIGNAYRPKDGKGQLDFDNRMAGHDIAFGNRVRDAAIKGDRLELVGAVRENTSEVVRGADINSRGDAFANIDEMWNKLVEVGAVDAGTAAIQKENAKQDIESNIVNEHIGELEYNLNTTDDGSMPAEVLLGRVDTLKSVIENSEKLSSDQKRLAQGRLNQLSARVGARLETERKEIEALEISETAISETQMDTPRSDIVERATKHFKNDAGKQAQYITQATAHKSRLQEDEKQRKQQVTEDVWERMQIAIRENNRQEAERIVMRNSGDLGPAATQNFRNYARNAGNVTDNPDVVNAINAMAADPRRRAEFLSRDFYGPQYGAELSVQTRKQFADLQAVHRNGASNAGELSSLARTLSKDAIRAAGLKKGAPDFQNYVMTRVNEYLSGIVPGEKGSEAEIRAIVEESRRDANDGYLYDSDIGDVLKNYRDANISIGDATRTVRGITGRASPENMELWREPIEEFYSAFQTTDNMAEILALTAKRFSEANNGAKITPEQLTEIIRRR